MAHKLKYHVTKDYLKRNGYKVDFLTKVENVEKLSKQYLYQAAFITKRNLFLYSKKFITDRKLLVPLEGQTLDIDHHQGHSYMMCADIACCMFEKILLQTILTGKVFSFYSKGLTINIGLYKVKTFKHIQSLIKCNYEHCQNLDFSKIKSGLYFPHIVIKKHKTGKITTAQIRVPIPMWKILIEQLNSGKTYRELPRDQLSHNEIDNDCLKADVSNCFPTVQLGCFYKIFNPFIYQLGKAVINNVPVALNYRQPDNNDEVVTIHITKKYFIHRAYLRRSVKNKLNYIFRYNARVTWFRSINKYKYRYMMYPLNYNKDNIIYERLSD